MQFLLGTGSITLMEEWNIWEIIPPLVGSLATAFIEEFLFRVLLLAFLLRKLSNNWLAVLIGSLVFALPHAGNSHVTAVALISHFVGGLVYSYAFLQTRRIWLPAGLHFGWNYTQIIFGISVSGSNFYSPLKFTSELDPVLIGGLYGFEGGLISIFIRVLILCSLMVLLNKTSWS